MATGGGVGGRKWLDGVGEPTRPRVQAAAAGTLQVPPGRPPVTGRFCENRPQLPLLREEVCTLHFGVGDTTQATKIEAK